MPTDAQPNPRPTRSGLKVLAVGIGLLLVSYPVSYGPASWMAVNGGARFRVAYCAVYDPIHSIQIVCRPVGRLFDWYRHMFVDEREWQSTRLNRPC